MLLGLCAERAKVPLLQLEVALLEVKAVRLATKLHWVLLALWGAALAAKKNRRRLADEGAVAAQCCSLKHAH